jgi:hypothetical protein
MATLNSLQLGFETKKWQFEQTDFLRDETGQVVKRLRGIENHLNDVLRDVWQKAGWMIRAGVEIKPVSDKLLPLFDVSVSRARFRTH